MSHKTLRIARRAGLNALCGRDIFKTRGGQIGQVKGDQHERLALTIATRMIEGLDSVSRELIELYGRAHTQWLEMAGFDIWLTIAKRPGLYTGFQIKSSPGGKRKFRSEARYNGVPCVIVNYELDRGDIEKNIATAINDCTTGKVPFIQPPKHRAGAP